LGVIDGCIGQWLEGCYALRSFVVREIELNVETWAGNRDSKFFIDSVLPRCVFQSWLKELYISLTTDRESRWYM